MAFGSIDNPITKYGGLQESQGGGLILFISNIIQLLTVAAGIFALFNLIIAGFIYISAGSDSKKTTEAWSRIYMSLIGIVIIVASYAVIAVVGQLLFGDPAYILNPTISGPGL